MTGILYTIPSLAFFFLLLPITGRGNTTALIALTAYTLLILFRNIVDGLDGVPEEARDAGRGMGLTDRQLLWRVELPLALPAIMAGLRIAATTTVGLAALATFAGAGGLGDQMASQKEFISNIAVGGGLCVLMAVGLDAILLLAQRAAHPLDAREDGMTLAFLGGLGDALQFIVTKSEGPGGAQVGGSQLLPLLREHLLITVASVAIATAIALPIGPWLGHSRRGLVPRHQRDQRRARRPVDRRRLPVLRGPGRRLLQHHARARPARHPADPAQRLHRRARAWIPRRSTPPAGWA